MAAPSLFTCCSPLPGRGAAAASVFVCFIDSLQTACSLVLLLTAAGALPSDQRLRHGTEGVRRQQVRRHRRAASFPSRHPQSRSRARRLLPPGRQLLASGRDAGPQEKVRPTLRGHALRQGPREHSRCQVGKGSRQGRAGKDTRKKSTWRGF